MRAARLPSRHGLPRFAAAAARCRKNVQSMLGPISWPAHALKGQRSSGDAGPDGGSASLVRCFVPAAPGPRPYHQDDRKLIDQQPGTLSGSVTGGLKGAIDRGPGHDAVGMAQTTLRRSETPGSDRLSAICSQPRRLHCGSKNCCDRLARPTALRCLFPAGRPTTSSRDGSGCGTGCCETNCQRQRRLTSR